MPSERIRYCHVGATSYLIPSTQAAQQKIRCGQYKPDSVGVWQCGHNAASINWHRDNSSLSLWITKPDIFYLVNLTFRLPSNPWSSREWRALLWLQAHSTTKTLLPFIRFSFFRYCIYVENLKSKNKWAELPANTPRITWWGKCVAMNTLEMHTLIWIIQKTLQRNDHVSLRRKKKQLEN